MPTARDLAKDPLRSDAARNRGAIIDALRSGATRDGRRPYHASRRVLTLPSRAEPVGLFVVHTNHGSSNGWLHGGPADGNARSDEGQRR